MTNILLINTNCSWNKGSAAQVISTKRTLSKFISNANFALVSARPELDSKLCAIHDIEVIDFSFSAWGRGSKIQRLLYDGRLLYYLLRCILWSILCKIGLNVHKLIDEDILREYTKSDLIVDLSGDTLSDKNIHSMFSILGILLAIFLKKKIAIFSQSIGPFKKITIPLARFCLKRVDLIVVRENVTKNYLKDIGVNNPSTYLAAEIAFLLEPAPPKKIQEIILKESINTNRRNGALIGVGPSTRISKNRAYVAIMAKIADYLVEKFNAQVVFISHVIIPPKYSAHSYDDRSVAKEIYQLARNKNGIKLIKGDYSPEELKGIIGRCDLFIGARMHSNIASTSMHVPTIALAWSHKYHGIMKMLGQEKYVCDIETAKFNEIIPKIIDAWCNRDEIMKKLASKTTELERSALYSARLVERLIEPISPE